MSQKVVDVAEAKLWKAYKLRFMVFMDKLGNALAERHLRLAKPQRNDVQIFAPDVQVFYGGQIYKAGEDRPRGDVTLILTVEMDLEFDAPEYHLTLEAGGYREDKWLEMETPRVRFGDPESRHAAEEEVQKQLAAWTSKEGIEQIVHQIVRGFHRGSGAKEWEPSMGSPVTRAQLDAYEETLWEQYHKDLREVLAAIGRGFEGRKLRLGRPRKIVWRRDDDTRSEMSLEAPLVSSIGKMGTVAIELLIDISEPYVENHTYEVSLSVEGASGDDWFEQNTQSVPLDPDSVDRDFYEHLVEEFKEDLAFLASPESSQIVIQAILRGLRKRYGGPKEWGPE